jgi:hypothetical protein
MESITDSGQQGQQQEYCLTWNNHTKNMTEGLSNFWVNQVMTDCMIACEGKFIKAHKVG